MPVPDEILSLEESSSSAAAYEALCLWWRHGERDRETALHLLFLAWDQLMEPPHLTGRTPETTDDELRAVFNEAHGWVLPDGARSTVVLAALFHTHPNTGDPMTGLVNLGGGRLQYFAPDIYSCYDQAQFAKATVDVINATNGTRQFIGEFIRTGTGNTLSWFGSTSSPVSGGLDSCGGK